MARARWWRAGGKVFNMATQRNRRPPRTQPSFQILEDRLAPAVTLSISNPVPFPKPDTGQLMGMFVVTRSGDTAPSLLVDFATQDGAGANGAHAGTDYVATSGTLAIGAAQTTATITVPILGNTVFQADKTFTVSLSNPRSAQSGLSFMPQQTFAVGSGPTGLVMADFNGDGKPDLVTGNDGGSGNGNTISVLLNTTPAGATTPSFAAQQTFAVGSRPQNVAVADINGDSKPDLIVANYGSNSVSVLLNTTPTGATVPSFAPQRTFAVSHPDGLAVGDFNGDGKPDLAVAVDGSFAVALLLNTTPTGATTPSFASAQTFSSGNSYPRGVAVGDFNGDGKPDLVVTKLSGSLSVLLNTTPTGATTASFAPQVSFATNGGNTMAAVADLNGDGKPDLAVANVGDNTVSVLLNTTARGATTPSFAAQQIFAVGRSPWSVAVGDFDGDGKPDLAVPNRSDYTVSVLRNTTPTGATAASFATQQTFGTGIYPEAAVVGDFNADGKPDLAVANAFSSTLSVFLNNTSQTTITISGSPATGTVSSAAQAPVVIAVVSGTSPQTQVVNMAFPVPPAVDVRDAAGHLVQGVSVAFTAPTSGASGQFAGNTTATVVTNASGRATAPTFTANTVAGTNYQVAARAAGGSDPATGFTLTNTPGVPATLAATAGGSQSTAVGRPFTTSLLATLTDQYGNRVPGVTITFAAPATGASATFTGGATGTTDANGQASKAITANTVAGTYTIMATASGGSNPTAAFANLTNTAGLPATLMAIAGANQGTAVNTAFDTNLLATLTDQYGNRVSGVTITFAAPPSGASATFSGGATGTTDANGQVSKAITANTVAGTYTITATAGGGSNPAATFTNLTNNPGPPATLTATAGGNQTATVSRAFTTNLLATLTDQYGNRIPGVTVAFTAPATGASVTFTGGATGTTDANGQVSKAITANTVAGTYAITAAASGGSNPTTTFVSLANAPGAPATLTATAGSSQSTAVNTAFATNLLATLADQYGNRVPGVTITFAAPPSGASATFSGGATGTTDANGQVSKAITANTVAGTFTITAAASGGSNPTAAFINLTNTPGAPATLTAAAGSNQSAAVNSTFATNLLATLTDQYGNRIPGVTVTFTAPASGASAAFTGGATATTDAGGQVSKVITANTVAGTYSILAAASGGSNPTAAFAGLSNTPGAPATLTATAGSNQSTAVNTAFAASLVATVTDQYGNRVSGVTVTFTAPASGASATFMGGNTGITDAGGQVSKAVTANTVAGTYSIMAMATGGSNPTATFANMSNSPGVPATLTAAAGSNQGTAVNTAFGTNLLATLTDQYGNRVPGVTITFAAPTSGASATFSGGNTGTTDANGQVSKTITANTVAGTYTITATAGGGSNPAATFTNLTNTPDAADHYAVSTTATNPDVAGTPFDVTVVVQDAFSNTVIGYTGTVHFSSGDPSGATLPADYTFGSADQGRATFPAATALYTAGTWDVTATDTQSSIHGAVRVTVVAAALDHFAVTASVDGTSAVAGSPFDVTVTAQDIYGNTVIGYSGTATFSSQDPYGATLPADYTFQPTDQGQVTFYGVTALYTAGTWDVTVTDPANGAIGSDLVTVQAAPAVAFQVRAPARVAPGAAFDVTVIAVDPYGNTDTNYTGTVTFSTTDQDPGVVLPPDYTFQPADMGMATFAGGVTLMTKGDQTFTATDTANDITGSTVVTVRGTLSARPVRGQPAPAANLPQNNPVVLDRLEALDGLFSALGRRRSHELSGADLSFDLPE